MKISELYRQIKEKSNEKGINLYKSNGYLSAKKIAESTNGHDIEALIAGMNESIQTSKGTKGDEMADALGAFIAYYEAYEKELGR